LTTQLNVGALNNLLRQVKLVPKNPIHSRSRIQGDRYDGSFSQSKSSGSEDKAFIVQLDASLNVREAQITD
jgi:hypothetical protein